jgi:murein L,D-transpeptidase YafK
MRRAPIIAVLLLAAGCTQPNESARRGRPLPPFPPIALSRADFVLVEKSDRTLTLFAAGQPIRTYRGLQLGDAPEGHKHFEGDERTPEGRYTIDTRNPASAYHLSLHISYPNAADRAFAVQQGRSPGGAIFIHGQPNWLPMGRLPGDWTDGCIALSNAEIEELWRLVPDGTSIEIGA